MVIDTNSISVLVKTSNFCIEIVADTRKIYDTSNYDQKGRFQPLTTRKNIKLFRLIKDEMGGKIIRRRLIKSIYML